MKTFYIFPIHAILSLNLSGQTVWKKVCLLLLITISPVNLIGQQYNEMVLDSTISYEWDSDNNDWAPRWRYVYAFDVNGNQTEGIHYEWDSAANDLVQRSCSYATFDSNGNQTEEISYDWNYSTNDLEGSQHWIHVYDGNGNLTDEIWYDWHSGTSDWIYSNREIHVYDSNSNRTETISYDWKYSTKDWVNSNRKIHEYDSNNNRTETISYDWDSGTNDWVPRWRSFYAFDANGNQIERLEYDWDWETNDWKCSNRSLPHFLMPGRIEYYFDTVGNQTEEYWWYCESEFNDSIERIRKIYTYDANGNLTEEIHYDWDSEANDWASSWRQTSVYDSNSNLTEEIRYEWDYESNDWAANWQLIYVYDNNSILTEEIRYDWDSETNDWHGNRRLVSAHDSNGNLIEEVQYDWYSETDGWSTAYPRSVHSYDSIGNRTETIVYRWNFETFVWANYSQTIYVYDGNSNLTEEIMYEWDAETNDWIFTYKRVFYWSYTLIQNQVYYVDENCSECSIIGTLMTGLNYPRKNISFHPTGEDTANVIALDTVTGDILVLESGNLDYETTQGYSLTVEAQFEDITGIITDKAIIRVYVNNINDNVPVVNDTIFYIYENSDTGAVVGQVIASDDDGELNPLTYSIISGVDSNSFLIDSVSGKLYVNSDAVLDYESQNEYSLTVVVSDGIFTDTASISVEVFEFDETAVGDINSDRPIKIYPNPANEILYIKVPEEFKDGFEVEMINLSGRVIFHESGFLEQIDISEFQEGIYFIQFKAERTTMVQKLIIQ